MHYNLIFVADGYLREIGKSKCYSTMQNDNAYSHEDCPREKVKSMRTVMKGQ